jgi:hypothetical protein
MLKPISTKVRTLLLKKATPLLAAGLCLISVASYAQEMVTDKDLEVAVRSLGFAYVLEKSDFNIEIVADPSVPASSSEASRLHELIKNTRTFAGRIVNAQIVPVSGMGSTGGKVAYVTHGLDKDFDAILDKAKAGKILTFSTDFHCVESSKCVMGVTGQNIIKIEISRSAAAASGVEFSQALKLMVGEVN